MDSINENSQSRSGKVCIPRTVVNDPKYRYTRPIAEISHEGRGGAARTVIKNIREIDILQFCGISKGSTTKHDTANKLYFLKGTFSVEDIETLIEAFIATFVLCPEDRSPETDVRRKKSSASADAKLYLACAGCGTLARVPEAHKLTKYILTTYDLHKAVLQAHAEKYRSAKKAAAVSPELPVAKASADDWDTDWSVDTSETAVNQRRADLLGQAATKPE